MKTLLLSSMLLLNMYCLAKRQNDLIVNYTKTDVSCAGQNNGSIALSIIGGKQPYTVTWMNGQKEMEVSNLRSGKYSVEIKDAKGQLVKQEITIEEPAPLGFYYKSDELTKVAEFNSIMDISIFGGNPWDEEHNKDYFIRLNGKSYYENPEKLNDGLYDLSIEDAKGCTFTLKVNINVEVVKSPAEISIHHNTGSSSDNSFGVINMFVVHHSLMNSSILQNHDAQNLLDYSIR